MLQQESACDGWLCLPATVDRYSPGQTDAGSSRGICFNRPLDFWRVELYEPPRILRLHAEMKLPGRAWLEFEVTPGEHGSCIRQTAIFDPLGLLGLLYCYGIYRLRQCVFAGMLRSMARAAQQPGATPPPQEQASASANSRH